MVIAASTVFGMWQAQRHADRREITLELNEDLKEAVDQAELAKKAALASQKRAEINATQFKSLLQYNPDSKLRAADLNPDYVRAESEKKKERRPQSGFPPSVRPPNQEYLFVPRHPVDDAKAQPTPGNPRKSLFMGDFLRVSGITPKPVCPRPWRQVLPPFAKQAGLRPS